MHKYSTLLLKQIIQVSWWVTKHNTYLYDTYIDISMLIFGDFMDHNQTASSAHYISTNECVFHREPHVYDKGEAFSDTVDLLHVCLCV